MNTRTNYTLVGLFVLVLSVMLIAGILWFSAGGHGVAYDEYRVYMQESVAGLNRDSTVKYHGVDVGRVHELGLDPGNPEQVRLQLQIRGDTMIREDTVATLETQGLTGLAYINLVGGSPDSPPLTAREGEEYPVIQSRPSVWGRLDRSLGELIDNLLDGSKRLKRLLSEENQRHFSATLAHLDTLSGTLSAYSDELGNTLADLSATLSSTREAGARLPELISQLERSAAAMERMADEIGAAGGTLRETVQARDRDLQRFTGGTLTEAAAMMNDLRQAAENLRSFSEQIERNPGVLLQGPAPLPRGPGE